MPESRMGHIAEGLERSERQAAGDVHPGHPSGRTSSRARSRKSIRSAEVRGEDGNTVLVRVSFDQADAAQDVVQDPKIGAGATAKIHCGQRSIGYVWLHDLVDFIRAKILFRSVRTRDAEGILRTMAICALAIADWRRRGTVRAPASCAPPADPGASTGCLVKLEDDIKLPAKEAGRARPAGGEGRLAGRQGEVIGKIDDSEPQMQKEGRQMRAGRRPSSSAKDDVEIRYAAGAGRRRPKGLRNDGRRPIARRPRRCPRSKFAEAKLEWDRSKLAIEKAHARSRARQVRRLHEAGRVRRRRTGDQAPRRSSRRSTARSSSSTAAGRMGRTRAITILQLVRLDTMRVDGAVEQSRLRSARASRLRGDGRSRDWPAAARRQFSGQITYVSPLVRLDGDVSASAPKSPTARRYGHWLLRDGMTGHDDDSPEHRRQRHGVSRAP